MLKIFTFVCVPSPSSSENYCAEGKVKTGPVNRAATMWENSSPAPGNQSSAQVSSSNAALGENQPKLYPQPQPRSQLQAKSQSQTQNATHLKADNSPEDGSEQPHSPEATLKITTPFKRMMFYININPLH